MDDLQVLVDAYLSVVQCFVASDLIFRCLDVLSVCLYFPINVLKETEYGSAVRRLR